MSQETTTQLLALPTEYGIPGEGGKAFSAAEVDQRSASRMLRVLMIFAWTLAGAVVVSALLGYGTPLSNWLAGGWFAVFSVLLIAWPKMDLAWHRGISVAILLLVVARWSAAWLLAEPADAIIGVMIGLLLHSCIGHHYNPFVGSSQLVHWRCHRADDGLGRFSGQ